MMLPYIKCQRSVWCDFWFLHFIFFRQQTNQFYKRTPHRYDEYDKICGFFNVKFRYILFPMRNTMADKMTWIVWSDDAKWRQQQTSHVSDKDNIRSYASVSASQMPHISWHHFLWQHFIFHRYFFGWYFPFHRYFFIFASTITFLA